MVIGRVYTLTLVLNLTIRLEDREQLVEETVDRTENFNLKNRTGGGGIRVDRSVVVQADREEHNFAVQVRSPLSLIFLRFFLSFV